jgi:hypothetical protein
MRMSKSRISTAPWLIAAALVVCSPCALICQEQDVVTAVTTRATSLRKRTDDPTHAIRLKADSRLTLLLSDSQGDYVYASLTDGR